MCVSQWAALASEQACRGVLTCFCLEDAARQRDAILCGFPLISLRRTERLRPPPCLHPCSSIMRFFFGKQVQLMWDIKAGAACGCRGTWCNVWSHSRVRFQPSCWSSRLRCCQKWLTGKISLSHDGQVQREHDAQFQVASTCNLCRFRLAAFISMLAHKAARAFNEWIKHLPACLLLCFIELLPHWLLKQAVWGEAIFTVSPVLKLLVHKPRDKHEAIPFFIQTRTPRLAFVLVLWNPLSARLHWTSCASHKAGWHPGPSLLTDNKLDVLYAHSRLLNIHTCRYKWHSKHRARPDSRRRRCHLDSTCTSHRRRRRNCWFPHVSTYSNQT